VPILAIFTGNNVTKQMYETLRKEVDWEHNHPAGVILHAAGFDESGNNVRVADIWESEEQLNNFVSNRLMPVMQKGGVPATKVETFQINDVSAYSGIDKYRLR
jgi:precorrin-4 methylase